LEVEQRRESLKKIFFFIHLAVPSMMFAIYFPVCLRAILARLVPKGDRGMRKNVSLMNIDC